jgi:hypothetical protein
LTGSFKRAEQAVPSALKSPSVIASAVPIRRPAIQTAGKAADQMAGVHRPPIAASSRYADKEEAARPTSSRIPAPPAKPRPLAHRFRFMLPSAEAFAAAMSRFGVG